MKPNILIVDDDESIRASLALLLDESYKTLEVSRGEDALEALNQTHIDAVLLDVKMNGLDGLETLKLIREHHEQPVVIMLTVLEDIKTAVTAIKLGANDYLRKPYNKDELLLTLERNLQIKNEHNEIRYLKSELDRVTESKIIIGQSAEIKKVFTLINQASQSNTTVLITGETGTGKELVARELHKRSPHANKPFVIVNCATIPRDLLESELFGHEKGAFTGALKQKLGKVEIANDGIIFFDEIGCLPIELQSKLLRALQEKTFERVGGTVTIPTNARFIFATNENLKQAVKQNTFRMDLYYRINVFPILVPPLRERKEDIPLLVDYFLNKYCIEQRKTIFHVSPPTMDHFVNYSWPGNIRQLENEIEKLVTIANAAMTTITPDLISEEIRETHSTDFSTEGGLLNDALESLERKMIQKALHKFNGNKTKAAQYLGISRRGLHKKLDRFGESLEV
ncbi:sigma-54-dependent Fis family transcriptional regulator [candidate division KSB1 bacterium]|nr:sigma-54-dependent Fis family transcriptional regulator [candidate division KSB1 bacterium]